MRRLSSLSKREGQVALLMGLIILMMVFLSAIVLDLGLIYNQRLRAQTAADLAALAAVQELPGDQVAAEAVAKQYLAANGYDTTNPEVTYSIEFDYDGQAGALRVVVARPASFVFAKFWDVAPINFGASASAGAKLSDTVVVIDASGSMCIDSHGGPMLNCPSLGVRAVEGLDVGSHFSRRDSDDDLSPNLNGELIIDITPGAGSININGVAIPYQAGDPGSDSLDTLIDRINASAANVTASIDFRDDAMTIARSDGLDDPITLADTTGSFLQAMRLIDGDGDIIGTETETANGDPTTFWDPFGAVLAATLEFMEIFDPTIDRLGLVVYSSNAVLEVPLTFNFGAGTAFEDAVLATAPSGYTNIGGGIEIAKIELDSNGRPGTEQVMVLLTDGIPNRCGSAQGGWNNCWSVAAENYAMALAARAKGVNIYTIGLGTGLDNDCEQADPNPDNCLLAELAEIGSGEYVWSPTSEDLADVFEEVASIFRIGLLE